MNNFNEPGCCPACGDPLEAEGSADVVDGYPYYWTDYTCINPVCSTNQPNQPNQHNGTSDNK
jgi:hypothetical protein